MRPNRFAAALILCLSFCSAIQLYSQSTTLNSDNLKNIKVDALSDSEIKSYYQRATAAGLTPDQLMKMASDRGMPVEEIGKLKSRLENLGQPKVNRNDTSQSNGRDFPSEADRKIDIDAMQVPSQKIKRDTTIFGSELFMEGSLVFEPNLRIPSPGNYILGPDDQIIVNVFGYSEQTYNLIVNAEGNVYIQNVGPIKVVGNTIEEASDRIKNKLASTIYKAIKTGQTKVEISLSKIRSIRVTVIGQATKPGTYTVSSFTTLFNLLYQCGGPNDMGSYRNIEVIRGNKIIRKVDLYAFLMDGDRKDNLLLEEQDVVRIPYYSIRTKLEGQAKRIGKFELLSEEKLGQLLKYSGGFSDSAHQSSVQVTRLSDNGYTLFTVNATEFNSFLPKSGDAVVIGKALNRYLNRVTVDGAVMRPGDFELKSGMNLKELLALAGGVREDAYLDRAIISRVNEDLTSTTLSFAVKEVLSGKTDLVLKKEDVVKISSIFDLKDQEILTIEGEVRNPGSFAYSKKITLRDLILKAGNFTDAANPKMVEISRRIKNTDVTQSDFQQTQIIKVDIENGLTSSNAETELLPFDAVVVRAEPGYNRRRWVYLDGQVMNAGRYVLEASSERISHLLLRAGGFKGSADSSSITVKRLVNSNVPTEERQKIVERMLNINPDSLANNPRLRDAYFKNVELLGVNVQKVKATPGGNEDLILEDGDVITVSRASNLVRVSGEVRNPTLLAYEEGDNAKKYIKGSGGFTDKARKSGVFVIYPDGRSKPVKQFLWFKKYPKMTPRSEVFVPAKAEDNKKGFGTGEWIAVSSIVASLATMLVALINITK
jgi:protein involved in polysaccharide export with SLBB domain